jgi:hypothetical protein
MDLVTTTQEPAVVADIGTVKDLLTEYRLPALQTSLNKQTGQLAIWGNVGFNAYHKDQQNGEESTSEFLYRLSTSIQEGDCFKIRTAGGTDDGSVIAYQYAVCPNVVTMSTFDYTHRYIEPPGSLRERVDKQSDIGVYGQLVGENPPEEIKQVVSG